MDVGFYYMSNAARRLLGTLVSCLGYQTGGVTGCLRAAAVLAACSFAAAGRLSRGLRTT